MRGKTRGREIRERTWEKKPEWERERVGRQEDEGWSFL